MKNIIIRATKLHDVELLSEVLRGKDNDEVCRLGLTPYDAIFESSNTSIWSKTAFVKGEIAAIWGVSGDLLSEVGSPFLLTSSAVYCVTPLKFARIYKKQLSKMLKIFPVLENYVDAEYLESVRMLKIAGAKIFGPEKINGFWFHKFRFEV